MNLRLLALVAALALPTAINAEEFIEIKPRNPYSYKKSSLYKYENKGKKYIEFLGTSLYLPCFSIEDTICYPKLIRSTMADFGDVNKRKLVWEYELDCNEETFNRKGDNGLKWMQIWVDPTAVAVAEKYCPTEEWSKLPNK